MKNDITISELAKLMNVSVHQIRYFEQKGALLPAYIDHNQYRMYGLEQIYQLAHILLLRKVGVPVQSIPDCMNTYSSAQYQQLFQQSVQNIVLEITRLEQLQQLINKILREQQHYSTIAQSYSMKYRNGANFSHWLTIDAAMPINARLLADQTQHIPDLFDSDIHYIYDNTNTVRLYIETKGDGDLSLPAGNYLSKQAIIDDLSELDYLMEDFYSFAASESYETSGPLIIIERSHLSLFNNNKLHYELQLLVQPTQ